MSTATHTLSDTLRKYLVDETVRESPALARLREETAALPAAVMQISPEQGQLMGLLVRLTGARRAIEVGVFTGYSTLVVAQAMGPGGMVVACDISESWTTIARRHWEAAGVGERVDLRLAPAVETLDGLLAEGQAGTFDLAFIDADKTAYDDYYERCLELLRPGGLILVDNALWSGSVADPTDDRPDTVALRRLNRKMADDVRTTTALVPIGDGLHVAVKNQMNERDS